MRNFFIQSFMISYRCLEHVWVADEEMIRMRPHTRAQCQDAEPESGCCPECKDPTPQTNPTSSTTTTSGQASKDDPFKEPPIVSTKVSRSRAATATASTSASQFSDGVLSSTNSSVKRVLLMTELPAEILFKILSYMSFKEISHLRIVSFTFGMFLDYFW